MSDAFLAALAIEHGCELVTTDGGFSRLRGGGRLVSAWPDQERSGRVGRTTRSNTPATEQLALVAALLERTDDAAAPGPRVPAILLEHESELLPHELRA